MKRNILPDCADCCECHLQFRGSDESWVNEAQLQLSVIKKQSINVLQNNFKMSYLKSWTFQSIVRFQSEGESKVRECRKETADKPTRSFSSLCLSQIQLLFHARWSKKKKKTKEKKEEEEEEEATTVYLNLLHCSLSQCH